MRPKSAKPRSQITNVRLTEEERAEMERSAERLGFPTISEYIRHLHRSGEAAAAASKQNAVIGKAQIPKVFHKTDLGQILHGDSLGLLHRKLEAESVDLIMTSPPFGLVRKKSYGKWQAKSTNSAPFESHISSHHSLDTVDSPLPPSTSHNCPLVFGSPVLAQECGDLRQIDTVVTLKGSCSETVVRVFTGSMMSGAQRHSRFVC